MSKRASGFPILAYGDTMLVATSISLAGRLLKSDTV
jgi:hypothetical protein